MQSTSTENSPFCRNVLLATISSVMVTAGYAVSCLNPIIPVIQRLYNETYHNRHGIDLPEDQWNLFLALTTSLVIAGGFCGTICSRFLLHVLSRKNSMIALNTFHIGGILIIVLGAGLAGSYEAFMIGRFLSGIAYGVGINLVPVIIAEVSTHHSQAFYQSLSGVAIAVGTLAAPIAGHPQLLGNDALWPVAVALTAVPSIIYLCCVYWIPQTPHYILRNQDKDEALVIMKKLRLGDHRRSIIELQTMENEQKGLQHPDVKEGDGGQESAKVFSLKEILHIKQYRRQLLTVFFIYSGQVLSGINHIYIYSDQIFIQAGIPLDKVTYATIGVFSVQLIGSILGTKLVGRFGPRKLMLAGLSLLAFAHVITTISLATIHLSPAAGYVSIVGILLALLGLSCGPTLALFALAGELTIEPTRPTVLAISGGGFWFFGWFSGFIPPYLVISMGSYAMLFWAGLVLLFLIFVYFFVPQTKGKTVAEIQEFFKK